ncbi:MAG: hypothetical protein J6B06_07810 [Lachnospiraceae bacterium]|nr:hypothetical protein [Lachnospiraceae bacterium]
MRNYTFAALIAVLALTACSKSPADSDTTPAAAATAAQTTIATTAVETTAAEAAPTGYLFSPADNVQLYIHAEAGEALKALGEPLSCLEAASCAFQGTDHIYNFGAYEITTYEKGSREYIYDIYLLDDSVTTAEGIYIGCSKADMEAAYGTNYEEATGAYTYKKDGMTLQFITENGIITAIRYNGVSQ